MWRYFRAFVILTALGGVPSAAPAETITIIDDFSDGATYLQPDWIDGAEEEDTGLVGVLGGVRKVWLGPYSSGNLWINSGDYLGQARIDSHPGAATLRLSYGSRTSAGEELNLDWSGGGTITMEIPDFGPDPFSPYSWFNYGVALYGDGWSHFYMNIILQPGPTGISLSNFDAADLREVDGLDFVFSAGSIGPTFSQWLTLDSIHTNAVPEPSALLLSLCVLSLCAFSAVWRTRRPRRERKLATSRYNFGGSSDA